MKSVGNPNLNHVRQLGQIAEQTSPWGRGTLITHFIFL